MRAADRLGDSKIDVYLEKEVNKIQIDSLAIDFQPHFIIDFFPEGRNIPVRGR